MTNLIHFIQTHLEICRLIWFSCGLIALWIFLKIRPEFYKREFESFFKFYCLIVYMLLGPAALFMALTALIFDYIRDHKNRKSRK